MMPPTIATPAKIFIYFTIFSFKNFAFSGGISVGGGGGEDGDPSDIELCEGADPSDIELCEGANPSDAET
jgi:hypothetical protein